MDHATLVIGEGNERQPKRLTRYEDDPYAWAMEQADLLKERRFADLDLLNLADEIADVGRREYEKLESDLARFIQHLLKWDHQPTLRSRSWVYTIREHRRRAERRLRENPSLKGRRDELLQEAFKRGRAEALIETGLPDDALPRSSDESWDEVMARPIDWPEP